jgi:hypothetical protein
VLSNVQKHTCEYRRILFSDPPKKSDTVAASR